MYRHILIPTDGSELAEHAVTNGLSLAKFVGAEVTVIIVEAPLQERESRECGAVALEQHLHVAGADVVARCDRGNRQAMVAERLQDIRFDRAQPCGTHATAFRNPCHISARAE